MLFADVSTFCAADAFDTLVVWRSAEVLEIPISARRVLLDLHDMPLRAELSAARLGRVDAVMVKSDFHRRAVIEAAPRVAARYILLTLTLALTLTLTLTPTPTLTLTPTPTLTLTLALTLALALALPLTNQVLMDCNMPVLDGFGAAKAIRK